MGRFPSPMDAMGRAVTMEIELACPIPDISALEREAATSTITPNFTSIVVGVSEECRSLVSAGPLGLRIGWRDELRDHVAGRAPRHIVEGRQILLHRAA